MTASIKLGDHIARVIDIGRKCDESTMEGEFTHQGIVVSLDPISVVHFSNLDIKTANVLHTDLATFMNNKKYLFVIKHNNSLEPAETVRRALELFKDGYGPFHMTQKNCEHFCTYCKTGVSQSKQGDLYVQKGSQVKKYLVNQYQYDTIKIE